MTAPESEWHELGRKHFEFAGEDNYEEAFTSSPSELVSEELKEDVTYNIIFAIFCVIGICANLLIIYIILRFKNMRTTLNIYFVNWSIADVVTLTTALIFNIVYSIEKSSISLNSFCIFSALILVLRFTTNFFVVITTIDWFIAVYYKLSSEHFRKFQKPVIAAVWILAVILICTNIVLCTTDDAYLGAAILTVLLSRICYSTLGLILVIQVIRAFQKCKKQLPEDSAIMLTLATIFVVINKVLATTVGLFFPQVILGCVELCLSVFNVGLLFWLDNDFKMYFLKVVKCSKTAGDETPEVDKTTNINRDKYLVSVHNPAEAERLNKV